MPRPPERYCLVGHRSRITQLALHPVYSVVATASEDASIRFWDYESGEHEQTLRGHSGKVRCVAFHPQGTMLASASTD